jgi:hypothetical protein
LLELGRVMARLGLRLVAERQVSSSRSTFVEEVCPGTAGRLPDPWTRLALLDASLELCANPVLWFVKTEAPLPVPSAAPPATRPEPGPPTARWEGDVLSLEGGHTRHTLLEALSRPPERLRLPHRWAGEVKRCAQAAERLLTQQGASLSVWLEALAREVGPRVRPPPDESELPGLALSDYATRIGAPFPDPVPWSCFGSASAGSSGEDVDALADAQLEARLGAKTGGAGARSLAARLGSLVDRAPFGPWVELQPAREL